MLSGDVLERTFIENVNNTNDILEEQFVLVASLVKIYNSVHYIDLEKDTYIEYVSSKSMAAYINKAYPASVQIRECVNNLVEESALEKARTFTELSTIQYRMKEKGVISCELKGKYVGWFRASYIAVSRNGNGIVTKVIFTTQIIDDEMKKIEGLESQSLTDELTGLRNRRGYENDLSLYPAVPVEEEFVYLSIDLNGLKPINDLYGHDAGDEMIKGAADCLKKCLGSYGRLYRVGGDEFVGMIFASPEKLEELQLDLDITMISWHGEVVRNLAMSCGYATKAEFPSATIGELAKIAEKRMYAQKAQYYSQRGIDRRMQQAAYNALCNSYMMILNVDLLEDSFSIIQLEDADLNSNDGVVGFSTWFKNFVRLGIIFEEDIKLFLKKTSVANLQRYFAKGKTTRTFHYRRRFGDEFKFVMMEIVAAPGFNENNQRVFLYVKKIEG